MFKTRCARFLIVTVAISSLFIVSACGGGGGGGGSSAAVDTPPSGSNTALSASTVSGTLNDTTVAASLRAASVATGTTMTLDDGTTNLLGSQGSFTVTGISDGDHSFYVAFADGRQVEIPFRMSQARGLDFGMVTIHATALVSIEGFDGYHFGFVDDDGDGVNDNFIDADGDGICDASVRFAGYPYMTGLGYLDADGDGINDYFVDADGDGINCDRAFIRAGVWFC